MSTLPQSSGSDREWGSLRNVEADWQGLELLCSLGDDPWWCLPLTMMLCAVSSNTVPGWSVWPTARREVVIGHPEIETVLFILSSFFGITCCVGEPAAVVWASLWGGPWGRGLDPPANSWWGSEACQQCEWAGDFILQFRLSLKMLGPRLTVCLFPYEEPWARTTLWSQDCMPDPQKLCEIINGSFFILFKFGGNLLCSNS